MKDFNIEINNPKNSFYFSQREVFGNFTMKSNHFHDQYEIYYLLKGERNYFIKDRVYKILPGNLVFINKYELHKTTDGNSNNHTRILINLRTDYFKQSPDIDSLFYRLFSLENNVIEFSNEGRNHIENLFKDIIEESQRMDAFSNLKIQSLIIDLMIFSARNGSFISDISVLTDKKVYTKMSDIVKYINENFPQNITLPLLSNRFFISKYHLSRAFKESTGFTFIEYLNSVRIREAQRLLVESDLKIIDISQNIGFGNVSHFGRVFKEITGHSPSQYKKSMKA